MKVARHRVHKARATAVPRVVARAPTPFAVAQQEAAVPVAYALIASTICESGPAAGPIADNDYGGPGAPLAPEGVGVPVTALTPVSDDTPGLVEFVEPPLPPTDEPAIFLPGGGGNPPLEPPPGPPLTPIAGIPEPATWAMLLLGFGGAGVGLRAARKHRRNAA